MESETRVQILNEAGFFFSLHANALGKGMKVYVFIHLRLKSLVDRILYAFLDD